MSVEVSDNSGKKIPVNGESLSMAYFNVPPFLTCYLGTASLKLTFLSLALLLLLFPQAVKVNAAPDNTVIAPNHLTFFNLFSSFMR